MIKKIKTLYENNRDDIKIVFIFILGSTLLMTTGFALYKLIVYLSDFIIISLLAFIAYKVSKILNIMKTNKLLNEASVDVKKEKQE